MRNLGAESSNNSVKIINVFVLVQYGRTNGGFADILGNQILYMIGNQILWL